MADRPAGSKTIAPPHPNPAACVATTMRAARTEPGPMLRGLRVEGGEAFSYQNPVGLLGHREKTTRPSSRIRLRITALYPTWDLDAFWRSARAGWLFAREAAATNS
jgi:hypothetical protein